MFPLQWHDKKKKELYGVYCKNIIYYIFWVNVSPKYNCMKRVLEWKYLIYIFVYAPKNKTMNYIYTRGFDIGYS